MEAWLILDILSTEALKLTDMFLSLRVGGPTHCLWAPGFLVRNSDPSLPHYSPDSQYLPCQLLPSSTSSSGAQTTVYLLLQQGRTMS